MATPDRVGADATYGGTNQFKRKGHTAGAFGNDPAIKAKGAAAGNASDLKA